MQTEKQRIERLIKDLDTLRQEVSDSTILEAIEKRSSQLLYQYLATK